MSAGCVGRRVDAARADRLAPSPFGPPRRSALGTQHSALFRVVAPRAASIFHPATPAIQGAWRQALARTVPAAGPLPAVHPRWSPRRSGARPGRRLLLYPSSRDLVRLPRLAAVVAGSLLSLAALPAVAPTAGAQQAPRRPQPARDSTARDSAATDTTRRNAARRDSTARDTLRPPGEGVPPEGAAPAPPDPAPLGMRAPAGWLRRDTLAIDRPPPFTPFGRFAPERRAAAEIAGARAVAVQEALRARTAALWGRTAAGGFGPVVPRAPEPARSGEQVAGFPVENPLRTGAAAGAPLDTITPDSARAPSRLESLFGEYADLGLQLQSRLEAKLERNRNERCISSQFLNPVSNCQGTFQPQFDFQFNVRTGGVVAERVHVNVDYDSQREFDASNNISVYYEGKTDELLQRIEVGNVSFQPPPSRFITGGIPSGNYGIQASGQLGPMRFQTIVAQQKGNVVKDRQFTVGDRSLQSLDADIEDYRIEARRFFFTVDPRLLPGYPNIDVLNQQQLNAASAALSPALRPTQVRLYRLRFNEQPANPNGPKFQVRGAKRGDRGPVYELLQPNIDYYLDPSLLWFALVRPVSLANERLVVAYNVAPFGPDGSTVNPETGGTPDIEFREGQLANLVWDPDVTPADSAFYKEIRSIYRLGGDDIQRQTVSLKVVTGNGSDQEKPADGTFQSYLQMFQLAQSGNPSAFDVDNRLWPRPGDPNAQAGTGTKLIRDYFVIFPSLRPFARADAGLVTGGNPANDTIYRMLAQDLYSTQRPPTLYHLRARFQAQGGGDAGSLVLGSVQVRPNSERLSVGGLALRRDVDYTVDYELGMVTFLRPDTLFRSAQQVSVQYEENPLFAAAPTSIFGLSSSFPMTSGKLDFTVISQRQRTTFNRPPLGFEPASSLVAGVSGQFGFDAAPLTRALERIPSVGSTTLSRVSLSGEFATSRPQPNAAGQAYVESFEGEGGITIALADPAWYYSSQPVLGEALAGTARDALATTDRAATMAWQNLSVDANGTPLVKTFSQIDDQVEFAGGGVQQPEQILWLTLHPLSVGGQFAAEGPQWTIPNAPVGGRRWRSIRTPLGPSGADLSRVETLEFWSLIRVDEGRVTNPTLIFDFGDVSENSIAFSPTTLNVTGGDSLYTGRQLEGYGVLDSERDPLTRGFNVATDDVGLPGDVVSQLEVLQDGAPVSVVENFPICGNHLDVQATGDTRTNCTSRNSRLDEEDLDFDGQLFLPNPTDREREEVRRYVVDMSQPNAYSRLGRSLPFGIPNASGGTDTVEFRWAFFRIPFRAPTDSIGNPRTRSLRTLRVTVVSGEGTPEFASTLTPLARLRLVGSPWLKRTNRAIAGVGGENDQASSPTSFVIASLIGTQDRDSSRGIFYQSPPGVVDQPENVQAGFADQQVQINERSLRLVAGDLRRYERAEAYYRFPEGQRNFMGYKELRVWARGNRNGWGEQGELQFYVKVGRDPNNFYFYRTPVNAGRDQAAWLPEVRMDFDKIFALRAEVQNAYLQNANRNTCTGVDSALIANSTLPAGRNYADVYARCDGGYMVFTIDPNVSPPNLAAVQELSVGMVRVDSGTGPSPILGGAADTLELWVDDIRLTDVVDTPGYAGQLALGVNAGDIADFRFNVSRVDPNFRQLAEQPRFISDRAFDAGTSIRLERLLPQGFGFALPLSVGVTSQGSDPFFLSTSDVRGDAVKGLRSPQSSGAAYSLSLRRTTPVRTPVVGTIINNLAVSSAYATSSTRSEYQEGSGKSFSLGVDYNLASRPRERRFPDWADRFLGTLPDWVTNSEAVRSLRGSAFRWNPSQLRLTSRLGKTSDRRFSFTKPAESVTDTARAVLGLTHVWQNTGDLEFRPFAALSARLGLSSLRDLRDYRDPLGPVADTTTLDVAEVAASERETFLGMDVGLERERTMSTALSIAPTLASWLRPRMDFGTSFAMLRDPNARSLLREDAGDSSGAYHLPRRLNNSQTFTAATTVDVGKALLLYTRDSSIFRRLASVFQPVDITFNRSLQSFHDGTAESPGLAYQFAVGGQDAFKQLGGRLASSAGMSSNFAVNGSFSLPFGTSLATRYSRQTTRSWSRLQDTLQRPVDGRLVTYPNVSLRWNYRPPRALQRVLSSVGANATVEHTASSTFAPSIVQGGENQNEESHSRRERYPVNGSIAWTLLGGFTTNGSYEVARTEDDRPGSSNFGRTRSMQADLGKTFPLPRSWKMNDRLNTRLSFQRSQTKNFVRNLSAAAGNDTRPLADNGRQSFNLMTDTRVSQELTFSFTGSRIVNFDNQYNRRFTQLVMTAVLQLQFFAGELR